MNIETFLNIFNLENYEIISIKEISKGNVEIIIQLNGKIEMQSTEIYFDFDFSIGENS